MKRAATNNEARIASSQRLQAAGKRAVSAYANVKRLAARLSQELEILTPPNGTVVADLDPEDSMVIAVEKVIANSAPSVPRARTNLGMVPMAAVAKKP